jgi:aryl-alcohol dehydrogenase-like predicted oxidoreductase
MTDLTLPRVGIGCNAFGSRVDADGVRAIVDAAIDEGAAFFDTADVYTFGASEELLGQAIGSRRDDVLIATKFGMDMRGANGDARPGSAEYIRRAIEASLRRLGTDYIDLYQFHTPDRETPIAETLLALDELVKDGKVRQIGVSNVQAWELVNAEWAARELGTARFVTVQDEYSLYNRAAEVELTPACVEFGVGILPYFPLAYGLLTDKYHRDSKAPKGSRLAAESQAHRLANADWDRIDQLRTFARKHDISLLELAIGGLAAQPAVVSVIAGVSKPEQLRANVAAAAWVPTPEELAKLAKIGQPTQSYTTYAT